MKYDVFDTRKHVFHHIKLKRESADDKIYLIYNYLHLVLYIFDGCESVGNSEVMEKETASEKQIQGSMSTVKFLMSPHVLLYFIGIVIPVVAGGYFLSYLYPLLGEELGMTETNIGYSYLINGVCIICLGGFLTKQLIRRIGQKGSLALATVLYAGAFLLYAVWPGIPTLMVLLVLLGA